MKEHRIRRSVFWIPFGSLLACAFLSIFFPDAFFKVVFALNTWILATFTGLFSWTTFFCFLLLIYLYFSPFAKMVIGGEGAKPIMSKWKWFSITLCTTIATGILFWGPAEPIFHLHFPPEGSNAAAGSVEARSFAMSTMYLHWTLTPYSIYTVMSLLFAISYYNLKQPFSLGSVLHPLFGKRALGRIGDGVDIICLFALVAGMSASLASGILSISGGFSKIFEMEPNALMYGLIALTIVVAFSVSAGSGLLKGIQLLSDINIKAFVALSIFIFLLGPTWEMIKIGVNGFVLYFQSFIPRSTNLFQPLEEGWRQSWTTFYWANWLAWAPVTSLFLGRLGVGYTVRDFINQNLLFTSLFGAIWMLIFSGTSLYFDLHEPGYPLLAALQSNGAESVIYSIFEYLPFAKLVSILFLGILFLSFVTAADSNTSAMGAISTAGISPGRDEAPFLIKLGWGLVVGFVAWSMISYAGIDGIRIISTIGGFPALFLTILVLGSWGRWIFIKNE